MRRDSIKVLLTRCEIFFENKGLIYHKENTPFPALIEILPKVKKKNKDFSAIFYDLKKNHIFYFFNFVKVEISMEILGGSRAPLKLGFFTYV